MWVGGRTMAHLCLGRSSELWDAVYRMMTVLTHRKQGPEVGPGQASALDQLGRAFRGPRHASVDLRVDLRHVPISTVSQGVAYSRHRRAHAVEGVVEDFPTSIG